MKINHILTYTLTFLFSALLLMSCQKEKQLPTVDDVEGLQLAGTLRNTDHSVELYTPSGRFQTGYNPITLQIKQKDGTIINSTQASWKPTMKMTSMSHSCPSSALTKTANSKGTYTGYMVFQMASNASEYWELEVTYNVDGKNYSITEKIQVNAAPKRVVNSFMGSDNKKYVVALVEPNLPKVAVNDMQAVLYEMKSMTEFVRVDNYAIKIDPRMPGMGNHTSPNNVDLKQNAEKVYQGKLSLTMTGYWKINLQVENTTKTIIKGEPVTEANPASSIYFELEF